MTHDVATGSRRCSCQLRPSWYLHQTKGKLIGDLGLAARGREKQLGWSSDVLSGKINFRWSKTTQTVFKLLLLIQLLHAKDQTGGHHLKTPCA